MPSMSHKYINVWIKQAFSESWLAQMPMTLGNLDYKRVLSLVTKTISVIDYLLLNIDNPRI